MILRQLEMSLIIFAPSDWIYKIGVWDHRSNEWILGKYSITLRLKVYTLAKLSLTSLLKEKRITTEKIRNKLLYVL